MSRSSSRILKHYRSGVASQKARLSSSRFDDKFNHFQSKSEENALINEKKSPFDKLAARVTKESISDVSSRRSNSYSLNDYDNTDGFANRLPKRNRYSLQDNNTSYDNASAFGEMMGNALSLDKNLESGEIMDKDDNTANISGKKKNFELFREVISKTRRTRMNDQEERAEREEVTDELDAVFKGIMPYLAIRDPLVEEQQIYESSKIPEIEALMTPLREAGGKMVRISADGRTFEPIYDHPSENKHISLALSDENKKLLKKIRSGRGFDDEKISEDLDANQLKIYDTSKKSYVDDFQELMVKMQDETHKAYAMERTISEAEKTERDKMQLRLQADRSFIPFLSSDMTTKTQSEWLEQGGDNPSNLFMGEESDFANYISLESDESGKDISDDEENIFIKGVKGQKMDSENTIEGSSKLSLPSYSGLHPIDQLLSEMDKFVVDAKQYSLDQKKKVYQAFIERLYLLGSKNLIHAAQSFRLILIEIEKFVVQGKTIPKNFLLLILGISDVLPASDFRHEVTTPLFILLSMTLMQASLNSLESVRVGLVLCTILVSLLIRGSKFCGEAVVFLLNVLALQLPRSALEPIQHRGLSVPFPLLTRTDPALLGTSATSSIDIGTEALNQANSFTLSILDDNLSSEQLLFVAYQLYEELAISFMDSAGFPAGFQIPFEALSRLFSSFGLSQSGVIKEKHDDLVLKISKWGKIVKKQRTPLAMRSFRPIPIRLFDPLLHTNLDPSLQETKNLRRVVREDKKRLSRQIKAESAVELREMEHLKAEENAQREKKYNQLVSELQMQQHIMNKVDGLMTKGKSKKRSFISGAPKSSSQPE